MRVARLVTAASCLLGCGGEIDAPAALPQVGLRAGTRLEFREWDLGGGLRLPGRTFDRRLGVEVSLDGDSYVPVGIARWDRTYQFADCSSPALVVGSSQEVPEYVVEIPNPVFGCRAKWAPPRRFRVGGQIATIDGDAVYMRYGEQCIKGSLPSWLEIRALMDEEVPDYVRDLGTSVERGPDGLSYSTSRASDGTEWVSARDGARASPVLTADGKERWVSVRASRTFLDAACSMPGFRSCDRDAEYFGVPVDPDASCLPTPAYVGRVGPLLPGGNGWNDNGVACVPETTDEHVFEQGQWVDPSSFPLVNRVRRGERIVSDLPVDPSGYLGRAYVPPVDMHTGDWCYPWITDAGFRCVPTASASMFADAACTMPVVDASPGAYPCRPQDPRAFGYSTPDGTRYALRSGLAWNGPVYLLDAGKCYPSGGEDAWELLEPIPSTWLAEVKEVPAGSPWR